MTISIWTAVFCGILAALISEHRKRAKFNKVEASILNSVEKTKELHGRINTLVDDLDKKLDSLDHKNL